MQRFERIHNNMDIKVTCELLRKLKQDKKKQDRQEAEGKVIFCQQLIINSINRLRSEDMTDEDNVTIKLPETYSDCGLVGEKE